MSGRVVSERRSKGLWWGVPCLLRWRGWLASLRARPGTPGALLQGSCPAEMAERIHGTPAFIKCMSRSAHHCQ